MIRTVRKDAVFKIMNEDVLIIKKAEPRQFQEVRAFYHSLIDGLEGCPYGAGWIKDVYPAPDLLRESIECGELYIAVSGSETVGAMVVNHRYNESYRSFEWPTAASDDEITPKGPVRRLSVLMC